MNAYTVNITAHLEDNPKFVRLGAGDENVFKVDDKKNTVLKIQQVLNEKAGIKEMDKVIELAIGKKGLDKINAMNLSMTAYQNIFIGIMAAINGKSFEETEKTFRNSL